MKDETIVRNEANQPSRQRLNTRISMHFLVTVKVPDGDGQSRELKARTLVVSHAGATLDVEEAIGLGLGVQVTPPFGGTILAEVNGAWLDPRTGRHRVSIRLVDPTAWTLPEWLSIAAENQRVDLTISQIDPSLSEMLDDYAVYLNQTTDSALTPTEAAAQILDGMLMADDDFQEWRTARAKQGAKSPETPKSN